jgi:hypothetical protein
MRAGGSADVPADGETPDGETPVGEGVSDAGDVPASDDATGDRVEVGVGTAVRVPSVTYLVEVTVLVPTIVVRVAGRADDPDDASAPPGP